MSQPLPITVNAVYEKGTLQLDRPLELADGTELQLTIIPPANNTILDAADGKLIGQLLIGDDEVFQALAK